VADARVDRRQHVGLAVDHEAEVEDQALVENRVDGRAIVRAALRAALHRGARARERDRVGHSVSLLLQYKSVNVLEHYSIRGGSASQIAASIEAGIRLGLLGAGRGLPTVRDLAQRLRVSPTTVAAAYQRLRLRGLIQSH